MRPPVRSLKRAFSLVEVVLSLGIFAFGIVGIMGLIPIAVQTHMHAKTDTIHAQIEQRLAAEALMTDFSLLEKELNGKVRYFDSEGVEVDPDSAEPGRVIYSAETEVLAMSLPPSYNPNSIMKVVFYVGRDLGTQRTATNSRPSGSIIIANTAPLL